MARKIPGRALDSNSVITINNISFSNTVTINATAILVGNSTVNTFINATSVTATAFSGNGANVTSVDAATLGGNTASTLRSYSDTVSATAFTNAASRADSAYSNAVAYAASNTYVNNTFLPLAGGTLTGNLTINAVANVVANLAANNVVIRGDIQIDGNLTVSGTSVTLNTASLAVEDNMIYLNNGSQVTHPDLGFAGNYNDGSYKHAGFFRDATDGIWKVFDGYTPEPDASAYIDTGNASFRIANFQANAITASNATFAGPVSGITTLAAGNTTITGFANVTTTLQVGTNTATIGTAAYVVANGNVGIGTGTPGYKLDVNGTLNIPADTWISAGGVSLVRLSYFGYSGGYKLATLGVTTSTSTGISLGADVTANPSGSFTGYEIVIPNNRAIVAPNANNNGYTGVLRVGTDNNLYIGGAYTVPGHMAISTANGNVGIGNTTPAHSLSVKGDARIGSSGQRFFVYDDGNAHLHAISGPMWLNAEDNSVIYINNQSNGGVILTNSTGTGNVGIGIGSPGAKLDVYGSSRFGGTVSAGRRLDIDSNGVATFKSGNNGNQTLINLDNVSDPSSSTDHGVNILARFGTSVDSSTAIDAGRISILKEQQWTGTSTTRDSYMRFDLAVNGTLTELARISSNGSLALKGPAGSPTIDTYTNSAVYANNATVDFPNFSGVIIANDHQNTGAVTMFFAGGGSASAIATHGTTVGTVTYNSGINGYTWTNNSGGSRTVGFMALKTRNGA